MVRFPEQGDNTDKSLEDGDRGGDESGKKTRCETLRTTKVPWVVEATVAGPRAVQAVVAALGSAADRSGTSGNAGNETLVSASSAGGGGGAVCSCGPGVRIKTVDY